MQTKSFHGRVKATGGDAESLDDGQFEALVSVFGNVDSTGDVVMSGAFAKSLGEWDERGDPIPVIWSHQWSDPFSHIGHVLEATETDDGLKVRGQLDLDNDRAHQVYRLLKGRRVTQFSFAFDVEDGASAERDGKSVYELRELKLHEVGPCLIGANQNTELLAAKTHTRSNNELAALRTAYDTLGAILSREHPDQDQPSPNDDGEGKDPEPEGSENENTGQDHTSAATDDDPEEGKSAASPVMDPAQVLAEITVRRLTGSHHVDAG